MKLSTAFCIAALCCLPVAGLEAEETNPGFILLIDEDAPGIEQLLDRRLGEAVETADDAKRLRDPLASHNLLCAAFIAKRDLEEAVAACDTAVDLAGEPITTGKNPHGHSNRDALAMAYSNRAVLNWLRGDADKAGDDIRRALRQNRHTDEIRHNEQVGAAALLATAD